MFYGSKLWWSALILAGAFVIAVVVIPLFTPYRGEIGKLPLAQKPPAQQPARPNPPNAFMPSRQGRLAPISVAPTFEIPPLSQLVSQVPSSSSFTITTTPQNRAAPSTKTQSNISPTASLLPLPSVPNSELSVVFGGAQSFEEFVRVLIDPDAPFLFERERFASLLKEDDGIPYSVTDLMNMSLASGKWVAVEPSLVTLQDFIKARIAYVKTVKVSGGAVEFARTMVAFDMLTAGLLDEVVANGGKPSGELQRKVAVYAATGAYQNQEIGSRVREQASSRTPDIFGFFSKLIPFIPQNAYAQAGGKSPFGGKINFRKDCTLCNFGFIITLKNAVDDSSLSLFISWATFASPLFYINKNPTSGQNIIGLYNKESGECKQPRCKGKCCRVDNYDGKLYMAGTS